MQFFRHAMHVWHLTNKLPTKLVSDVHTVTVPTALIAKGNPQML